MRKVISFHMITMDGYFEGTQGETGWRRVDEEVSEFLLVQAQRTDMMLFGRKTYQIMKAFWPTEEARQREPAMAEIMNSCPKIVFSRNMEEPGWTNARLVTDGTVGEVRRIKALPGQDIMVFGSASLASALVREDLLDELRLMINPVILGKGHSLFTKAGSPSAWQLRKTNQNGNGNVLLYYQPGGR